MALGRELGNRTNCKDRQNAEEHRAQGGRPSGRAGQEKEMEPVGTDWKDS